MSIVHDIGLWLWHLLPGNPILLRVVSTGGKRVRHLWARLIYLVALMAVFVFRGSLLFNASSASLSELAKQATRTFEEVSLVQLFLMSFIAPVFCAGAITQEKDSNTFHILLTTPLSNAQIVLGSLFSRLCFVWVLLLAGLPIFCITMIYGGVTTREILQSFGLAACTGLITGSIAIMISFLKIGTRRTIFAFFVGIAVYLLGIGAFGLFPAGQLSVAPLPAGTAQGVGSVARMSWLAPVHPYLALRVVIGETPAPPMSDVYNYGWPARWLLAYPEYGYMAITTLASVSMVLICLFYVRRGAREGEATIFTRIMDRVMPKKLGERRRKPRRVWRNPIAWREAATRASAGGRSLLRVVFIAAGFVAALILLIGHHTNAWGLGGTSPITVGLTRMWLTALVWIEMAVVLLVVTNTAATTLTREKESLTMELLLCTPLTSRYIIAGMLQGLVRLVVPLIAVPFFSVASFALVDLMRPGTMPVTTIEAAALVPVLMTAFAALAAMIGLHFSLLSKKTVQAVMISTAIVLGAAGLLWACGQAVAGSSSGVAAVVLPFTPFPALQALIDPWRLVDAGSSIYNSSPVSDSDVLAFRVTRVIFSLIAAAGYLGITFAVYSSMVRNFDMTVRKQSA